MFHLSNDPPVAAKRKYFAPSPPRVIRSAMMPEAAPGKPAAPRRR